MRGREFVLLILIIAVGVVFYHVQTGKWDFDWDDGIFFDYQEYSFTETKEFFPPFPLEIQVINQHGDIEIEGTSEDTIRIRLDKRIRRRDEEKAREVAEDIELIIDQDQQRIICSTNREETGRRNFTTDFILTVPAGMDIQVKNRYGDVKAIRVGTADIINRHGGVRAWDIEGSLYIENSYEDVEVDNVSLDCEIGSRQSDVNISRVKGSTIVSHRYGRLDLEDLEQKVGVAGSHLEIFGKNLAGPIELESSYEQITLIDVGPVTIRGDNSPISIERASGGVDIIDRYARVELQDIRGSIEVSGRDLGLWGQGLSADTIRVDTSYRDAELLEFEGETQIILSNADLLLRPVSLSDSLEVKGSTCNITMHWPEGETHPIEAQTKNGTIHWELSQEPALNITNGHSILKAFLQEEGEFLVRLSTTYADISIKQ